MNKEKKYTKEEAEEIFYDLFDDEVNEPKEDGSKYFKHLNDSGLAWKNDKLFGLRLDSKSSIMYDKYIENLVYLSIVDDDFFYKIVGNFDPNYIPRLDYRRVFALMREYYISFGMKPDRDSFLNLSKMKAMNKFDFEEDEAIWNMACIKIDKTIADNIKVNWKYWGLYINVIRLYNYIYDNFERGCDNPQQLIRKVDDLIDNIDWLKEERASLEGVKNNEWD